MLCQKCHKNLATLRYAEVVDGQVKDTHLCGACMAKQREASNTGFEFSGPQTASPRKLTENVVAEAVRSQRACPACGMTLNAVLETADVGCRRCYESFGSTVESLLEGLQQSLIHKGKVSHVDDARDRLRADLDTKRALLRSMLRAEKYEDAAILRDEIRVLEGGLYAADSGAD